MTSLPPRISRTLLRPLASLVIGICLLGQSGCVTEEVKPVRPAPVILRNGSTDDAKDTPSRRNADPDSAVSQSLAPPAKPPVVPADPNAATNADPCAVNLQNISGALLMFYASNQHMPEKLGEVSPLADPLTPFELRCPKSNLAYVYNPDGLRAENKSKVIILYDAADSHNGVRWCILMSAPKSIANRSLEVVAMPESTFRLYH